MANSIIGAHGSIGRSPAHAEQAAEPAPLEDRDHHAVGGADGQQVHDHGLERDEHGAEHGQQQHEAQHEHGADEPAAGAGRAQSEKSMSDGRLAADVGVAPGAEGVGSTSSRRWRTSCSVASVLRRGGREDLDRRDGLPEGLGTGGVTDATPGVVGDGAGEVGTAAAAAASGVSATTGQRAVGTRAEAVGEQVVGLAGGRAGGIVAGVGDGQAHAEGTGRPAASRAPAPGRRRSDRPALHDAGPAVGHRLARRPAGPPAVHAEAVDPSPDHAEERRQQGDGAEHGHEHGGRGAEGQALQEAQPHQQQPEQRDHHGAAGEHHGPPGGAHGLDRRRRRARGPAAVRCGSG